MSENVFIVHTETPEQESALKAFAKALKMKFEISKDKPYNPEFVAKIKQSEQEYKQGKFIRINPDEIDSFLGLK